MNSAPIDAGWVFDPIVPWPVVIGLGLLLLGFTIALSRPSGTALKRGQRVALLILRLIGLALVLLLLLQPSRRELVQPPAIQRIVLVGLDASKSMRQADAGKGTRFDAAQELLRDAEVVSHKGTVTDSRLRLFRFSDAAVPVTGISDLRPEGATTRLHQTVTEMLATVSAGESAAALVLLTDGHDFELVNPVRTAAAAQARQTPIFAVPLGKQGRVRDVSVRIQSFQPYTYVTQKARISAALRLIGCEFEEVQVQLLRQGIPVQTKRVNADELAELTVDFEVSEPAVGQVEYEVRALPLEGEVDPANNSALTYLNVIDQQIRVLVLEGAPYWDTTFLQRSLMRNDKFEVDSLVKYAEKKIRPIRKTSETNGVAELSVPRTVDDFARYDIVILGRGLEEMLDVTQMHALEDYVKNRGGSVIFARGPAFQGDLAKNELEPVIWGSAKREKVKLQVARGAASAGPFRGLAGDTGGMESLPELIAGHDASDSKPLTATLATAGANGAGTWPGMVHRRLGSGQVVSVGVEGLWRWGFNPKVEAVNTAFDRFWDQMLLWLLASRDFVPAKQFSFRPSTANVQLGEKVYFRLNVRQADLKIPQVPLRISFGDSEIARTSLIPVAGDSHRLTAEFLPTRTGRYRVRADFPDGTAQEARFIVFSENQEETEVATDVALLKRLCDASGGRILAAGEFPKWLRELRDEPQDSTPKPKLTSVWDRAWVFYVIGAVFGAEWYLRRRWGMS